MGDGSDPLFRRCSANVYGKHGDMRGCPKKWLVAKNGFSFSAFCARACSIRREGGQIHHERRSQGEMYPVERILGESCVYCIQGMATPFSLQDPKKILYSSDICIPFDIFHFPGEFKNNPFSSSNICLIDQAIKNPYLYSNRNAAARPAPASPPPTPPRPPPPPRPQRTSPTPPETAQLSMRANSCLRSDRQGKQISF